MKTFLILGGGTGGTMVANRMAHHLDQNEWQIIVVDQDDVHYYQPGFLFIPFGTYQPADVIKSRRSFLPQSVQLILSKIDLIEPEQNKVSLANGETIRYDTLVIATGARISPEETPGLLGAGWRKNIFDFYTFEGTTALANHLERWEGGKLVVNFTELPIKCPVAPLEFLFLADSFFREKGIRDRVDLIFATPLAGAFTKPRAASMLGNLLTKRGIHVEPDFNIMEADNATQVIRSYDGREVPYDLLITVPTNKGAEAIERSGMGDELAFVPTDKHTLRSRDYENVWIIGDAGNVPTAKAGSVAHYMLDVVVENILRAHKGLDPLPDFDGHANCFIETGHDRALLIDFNYEVEPLPGSFPLPTIGPMPLLRESFINHWGKMAFRWVYWNLLLKGSSLMMPSQMSRAGKQFEGN
jgi:sulfide:quinone oxidoreductase